MGDLPHSETITQTLQITQYPTNHTRDKDEHSEEAWSYQFQKPMIKTNQAGLNINYFHSKIHFHSKIFSFQMPFHYIYLITSNKSNTINFIKSTCLQFLKGNTADPGPDAPVCKTHKKVMVSHSLRDVLRKNSKLQGEKKFTGAPSR